MKDKKTLIEKIKILFETEDLKFLDVKDSDGNILRVEGEELIEGLVLLVITEDGEELTPDAEYLLEDGRIIKTDSESKIIEIIEAEESEEGDEEVIEEEMNKEDFTTITSITKWDVQVNADVIEEGTQLKEVNSEGDEWSLNDGEYILEDGTKIQVDSNGVVVMVIGNEEVVVEEEMSELDTVLLKSITQLKTQLDSLQEKFKTLSNEPAEEEIKIKKAGFNKTKNNPHSRIDELSAWRN